MIKIQEMDSKTVSWDIDGDTYYVRELDDGQYCLYFSSDIPGRRRKKILCGTYDDCKKYVDNAWVKWKESTIG